MQNPSFWARLGLLWCLFVFAACWCASATADVAGVAPAVPTLDGFGLLIMATLLGLAALWYWRRRE
ncbi:MAG: IPTL-CTERM sorting domain-containing protein [Betaproteobacteria bacterium]|nr:IPTL-CTERM sorting domain-containing protein [Betaproteobacteria bacterium]